MADNDKAAFGIYPGMGKRSKNNREAAKEMPLQALRGWAAGTLGLPGDIEGLLRTLGHAGAAPGSKFDQTVSREPVLPTSEFYKEWLPGHQDTPHARAANEIGSLFGGMGAGRVATGIKDAGKAVGLHAAEQIHNGMMGGTGALSKVLAPEAIRPAFAVKPRGGNWVPETLPGAMNPQDVAVDFTDALPSQGYPFRETLNKKIQKFIQNDFGSLQDPLLKLEAEGRWRAGGEAGLPHWYDVNNLGRSEHMRFERHTPGRTFDTMTPYESLQATHVVPWTKDLYRTELMGMMDEYGHPYTEQYPGSMDFNHYMEWSKTHAPEDHKSMSWLQKLSDLDTLYGTDLPIDDPLQIGHMVDYVKNAHDAHSGLANAFGGDLEKMRTAARGARGRPESPIHRWLPLVQRGLHLSPEQLERSSFADLMEKTQQWDEILRQQKQLSSVNDGIKKVHKTYDSGHQWVELDPSGLSGEGYAMGHCVGGYCRKVEEGSSRILSLRDKNGTPLTTVEMAPAPWHGMRPLNPEDPYEASVLANGVSTHIVPKTGELFRPDQAEASRVFHEGDPKRSDIGMNIVQIKGKFNGKPKPEATPMIQDLIKGGVEEFPGDMWGKVGDLGNTNMIESRTPGGGHTTLRYNDPATGEPQVHHMVMPEDRFYTTSDLRKHFVEQGAPEDEAARHAGDVDWLMNNIGN